MPIAPIDGTVSDIEFGTVRGTNATVYAVGSFSYSTLYSAIVGYDHLGNVTDYALDGVPGSQCTNIIYDSGNFSKIISNAQKFLHFTYCVEV